MKRNSISCSNDRTGVANNTVKHLELATVTQAPLNMTRDQNHVDRKQYGRPAKAYSSGISDLLDSLFFGIIEGKGKFSPYFK